MIYNSSEAAHPVERLRDWMRDQRLDAFIAPSTDAYLSEFAPPSERYLNWLTGFTGSTGVAIVARDAAALFTDTRYIDEARRNVFDGVEVLLAAERNAWLQHRLAPSARIAIDPWRHTVADLANWRLGAEAARAQLVIIDDNPLPALRRSNAAAHAPRIAHYPVEFAGASAEDKISGMIEHVRSAGLGALLVANPEDVSWLFNVRATGPEFQTGAADWHVVPHSVSRALVHAEGVIWFIDPTRIAAAELNLPHTMVEPPEALDAALEAFARIGPIGADLSATPAALADVVKRKGALRDDPVLARARWRKHPIEQAAARNIHIHDSAAIVSLLAWLTQSGDTATEWDAAIKLEEIRRRSPLYVCPSMPAMSASGPNGALPHYTPTPSEARELRDHPIYWLDSGGQYLGGSTDNTVTIALSKPQPKHIHAHTLVLKGLIALSAMHFPAGTSGLALDVIARTPLWRAGLDFGHATGHGVGNHLNIHEGPIIGRIAAPLSLAPLELGMIIANEPAYYAANDFGVRIETHMVVAPSANPGFLSFDTISRLPIDPTLVDFEMITNDEASWLRTYHENVVADLAHVLDRDVRAWLERHVDPFLR